MASIPSHAVVGLALGAVFAPRELRPRAMWVGALLAVLPDSDSILHFLGVPTSSVFGHRGLTHSLTFALAAGIVATILVTRAAGRPDLRAQLGLYFILAAVSHGILDAFTNGGPGIAFFAPFSSRRYFFPFRPIVVSPIGVHGVLGERGLRIFLSELKWILLPSAVMAGVAAAVRSRTSAL